MIVPADWRAIAVVVLAAANVRSTPNVNDYCHNTGALDGYHCASCLQRVLCNNSLNLGEPFTCPYPNVCEEGIGSATCVAMALSTHCQCDSNQCDGYNPAYVDLCTNDGMYEVLSCDDNPNMCTGLGCGAEMSTCDGANSTGFNFSTPDCTTATYCRSDNVLFSVQCDADQFVDDTGSCQPAPPEPCAFGCTGLCPDNVNCSLFYYCDAGTPSLPMSCPPGLFFNPNAISTQVCENNITVCARLTSCDFSGSSGGDTTTLTTTTITTTAETSLCSAEPPPCSADTVGNTAAAGPCCQSYWLCHNYGGGNYQPVSKDCPPGYIFNTDPAYPYCALPENVDTCDN